MSGRDYSYQPGPQWSSGVSPAAAASSLSEFDQLTAQRHRDGSEQIADLGPPAFDDVGTTVRPPR